MGWCINFSSVICHNHQFGYVQIGVFCLGVGEKQLRDATCAKKKNQQHRLCQVVI